MTIASAAVDRLAALSASEACRHDWSRPEIRELFELPFPELMFRAQSLHRASFDPNQTSGKDIQVETTFKQSDALLTWLQLIDVHDSSVQLARPLKGKFVIRGGHGG